MGKRKNIISDAEGLAKYSKIKSPEKKVKKSEYERYRDIYGDFDYEGFNVSADEPPLERGSVEKKPARTVKQKKAKTNQNNKILPLNIAFLGGLGEVGKNMTAFRYGDDMIIVDCGISFPDASMPGVDLVIPDFSYVEKNKEMIRAVFITHGHEDHIGDLPYFLNEINVPVYSTKLTIGLIKGKLEEAKILNKAKLYTIKPGDRVKAGAFEVEAIHVNHSIPDALAFAIRTDAGTVVMTGDFKIDSTPIDGEMMDLARFGSIGSEGVLALLSDSTNAERPGYTQSERTVGASFENLFRRAGQRRIIVATFSSNIHRVQQIINTAVQLGRKVALSGRSLENVVDVSTELGYLDVPDGILIDIGKIKDFPDDKLIIITTGSQGEPMSALTRMAMGDHRKVRITPNDFVIISARPIPGNEKTVGNVINRLMTLGAEVIYESMYDVHVSGHACNEEQKIILGLTKPKYFIPVHGEMKQLVKHAALGENMGIDGDHVIIASNGIQLSFMPDGSLEVGDVPAGEIYIDGYGVGDIGFAVLRERQLLSEDGVIVVTVVLDNVTGYYLMKPEITSRGFVFADQSAELFEGAEEEVIRLLDKYSNSGRHDVQILKGNIKASVLRYMKDKTNRSPVVIVCVEEV